MSPSAATRRASSSGAISCRSRKTRLKQWPRSAACRHEVVRGAARLYAGGGRGGQCNSAIFYGLGVTEHAQGSTMVIGIANLAMACGMVGREGVGVNPLRGQNNVQGSCDMGSFPHELPGYRHISDSTVRSPVRCCMGCDAEPGAGAAHPEHAGRGARRQLQGAVRSRRRPGAVRPGHAARRGGALKHGVRGGAGHLPERDGQVRPRLPARRIVPRKGRHLHQRRAPHQPRASGDAAAVGQGGLGGDAGVRERARLPDALRPTRRRSWTRSPR